MIKAPEVGLPVNTTARQKALYTLLAGGLLVALTALGLTALASVETNTPVYGFTDKYCGSAKYMWFKNLAALIAFDGKEDSAGTTWNFGSYYGDGENGYDCYEVKYREIVVIGTPQGQAHPMVAAADPVVAVAHLLLNRSLL